MDLEEGLAWSFWRDRMSASSRCDSGRAAGVWALGVLEDQLGSDWLARVVARDRVIPPEVSQASINAMAYAELLSMSASLEIARQLHGHVRVRKSLATDVREEVRRHSMLLLELGMLARHAGGTVALEPQGKRGQPPADARIELDDVRMLVEARAILFDDGMRVGRELSDRLSAQINQLTFFRGVHMVGEVTGELTEELVTLLPPAVDTAARQAIAERRAVHIEHRQANLEVMPQDIAQSGTGWSLPSGDARGWDRVSQILRDKVKQMQRSGATWLRIDLMDGLWQFSAWSQSPLGPKTEAMSGAVRAALGGLSGIRGVVMSSSCATTMSRLTGQSTLVDGTYGLVRDLGNFKGRETLVIPLVEDAEAEALAWVHLYDSEPSWLDTALGELGHPPMSELGAVQNIVG
jgi:hypothetical protein